MSRVPFIQLTRGVGTPVTWHGRSTELATLAASDTRPAFDIRGGTTHTHTHTHTHCCTLLTYLLTYLRTGGPPGCATSQSRDTLYIYIYTFLTIFHLINITCTKELIKNRLITKSADSKWGPWDKHMSITAVTECCMEQSSVPCTMRRMSLVAVPALLCAMQRYTPSRSPARCSAAASHAYWWRNEHLSTVLFPFCEKNSISILIAFFPIISFQFLISISQKILILNLIPFFDSNSHSSS